MDKNTLGDRLRERRLLAGISQAEIAKQTGMIQPDLSLLERGKKHVWADTLFSLATALDCSLDYLVGLTDDPTPPAPRQQRRTATPVG
jgi:transcriptional regulator with XRE-family HTH domain